jgi:hypothetical protein
MIRYGRMDVRFLLPLYHLLIRRLSSGMNHMATSTESMSTETKEGGSPQFTMLSSQQSLISDLTTRSPVPLNHSFSRYSFSFSEQTTSPNPLRFDAIDHIFSITLSNSSELWSPTLPDLIDKKSLIKISSLKSKYETFRRKAKSKNWSDQNTHVFMRYPPTPPLFSSLSSSLLSVGWFNGETEWVI